MNPNETTPSTPVAAPETTVPPTGQAHDDKTMAIVAYFIFFVPLLVGIKSEFVRFHTNQATVLFIVLFGVNILLGFIPMLFLVYPVVLLVMLGGLGLWVMGLIGAIKGEMKPLPLLGGLTIIK